MQTTQVRIWNTRWQAEILAPRGSKECSSCRSWIKDYTQNSPAMHRWRCRAAGAMLAWPVNSTLHVAHPEDMGSQAGGSEEGNLVTKKKHQRPCCIFNEPGPPWRVNSLQQLLPWVKMTACPLPHRLLLLQLCWLHWSPLTNLHL